MRCILPIAAMLLAGGTFVFAAEPSADEAATTARWIEQLGSPRFALREEATEALLKIGPPAMAALERSAQHRNREIRFRSEGILKLVRQRDLESRLTAFQLDRDPSHDFALTGWDRYRQLAGATSEAKQIFVEIQRYQADLLAAAAIGPREASTAVAARIKLLQQAQQYGQPPQLGDVAGLLFVLADARVEISDQNGQTLYGFCYQSGFAAALQPGPRRDVLRGLLGSWVERASGDTTTYQALHLAIQHDLRQGLAPAIRVLGGPPGQPPHVKHLALVGIGKFGDQRHIPLLETALDDTNLCMQHQVDSVRYVAQVRDVALSALIDLTKQNAADFGLTRSSEQSYYFNPMSMGFRSDGDRAKAHDHWKEVRTTLKR